MKIRTKLSVAECRARLGSATDLGGMALSWDAAVPGAVVGQFRGQVFRLHTPKYYQNAFAPFFYGQLEAADGATILEGRFRMHPFAGLFMVFWFSLLVIFAVAPLIVPAAAHAASGLGRTWYYIGLVVLAVLGVGFVAIGKCLASGEQDVIYSFLKNTLEGEDK